MSLFYSATTNGFYDNQIHQTMPDDVIAISTETHRELLSAQAQGARIEADKAGLPQATFPSANESFTLAKQAAHGRLTEITHAQRQKFIGTGDALEVTSRLNKYRLAQAYQAGTATPEEKRALEMEIEARASKEDLASFCKELIQQGAQLTQAVGVIDGLKHQHLQALEAVKSQDQLDALINGFEQQLNAALIRLQ